MLSLPGRNNHTDNAVGKILFIGHDASQTGAPILLLNLLRLLKQDNRIPFDIYLQRGGVLLNQYQELGRVTLLRWDTLGIKRGLMYRFIDWMYASVKIILLKRKLGAYELVFSNTIANGRLLKKLNATQIPVVSYVHELESVLKYYEKTGDTRETLKHSDLLICPATAVSSYLMAAFQVDQAKLLRLNYFFPENHKIELSDKATLRNAFCNEWGISNSKMLIVGAGTITERKGVDRFVRIAAKLKAMRERVQFIWIGTPVDQDFKIAIDSFIQEEGIADMLTFTGSLPASIEMFRPFDLFLLTSREDPYPLVVLEAARNQVPSICLIQNGGIPEFVQQDAGWSLNDASDRELASEVENILSDLTLIQNKGAVARQRYLSWHARPELILEQLNIIFAKAKNNKI